jgi:hypothetical protein
MYISVFESMSVPIQVVLEGNLVNMDVTSPAATLALALMYLKTNDAAIAASFFVPDTHFALDYVKPDFVLLRMLARGLVMWDSVQPTKEWVQSQLPDLIKVGVIAKHLSILLLQMSESSMALCRHVLMQLWQLVQSSLRMCPLDQSRD